MFALPKRNLMASLLSSCHLFHSCPPLLVAAMVVDIAAIYFGLFWGIFPFTAAKAVQQTCKILRRARNLRHHAYLYMIWVELVVNIIFNLASYLHLIGVIQAKYVSVLSFLSQFSAYRGGPPET
jgi:hypothetical protein